MARGKTQHRPRFHTDDATRGSDELSREAMHPTDPETKIVASSGVKNDLGITPQRLVNIEFVNAQYKAARSSHDCVRPAPLVPGATDLEPTIAARVPRFLSLRAEYRRTPTACLLPVSDMTAWRLPLAVWRV